MPERCTTLFAACAPRSMAETSEKTPVYLAIGVRAPATITTSVGNILTLAVLNIGVRCATSRESRACPKASLFCYIRHYNCVAAELTSFFDGEFRAIDQIRHDIFALIVLARRGFDDSCAQGDLRGIPGRTHAGSGTPKFLHEILRAGTRRVREDECQGPGR